MKRTKMKKTLLTAVVATMSATVVVLGASAPTLAQQDSIDLPQEVQDWMARDQVRRWAVMIQTGEQLFNEGTCFRCHGQGGSGGPTGPDLTDAEFVHGEGTLEDIYEVIFWGVRRRDLVDPTRRFQMNPTGGMELEPDEMEALAAYVWSLTNGTFLPQR